MPQSPQTDEVGLTEVFLKEIFEKARKKSEKRVGSFSDLPTGVSVTIGLIFVEKLLREDFSRDGST